MSIYTFIHWTTSKSKATLYTEKTENEEEPLERIEPRKAEVKPPKILYNYKKAD